MLSMQILLCVVLTLRFHSCQIILPKLQLDEAFIIEDKETGEIFMITYDTITCLRYDSEIPPEYLECLANDFIPVFNNTRKQSQKFPKDMTTPANLIQIEKEDFEGDKPINYKREKTIPAENMDITQSLFTQVTDLTLELDGITQLIKDKVNPFNNLTPFTITSDIFEIIPEKIAFESEKVDLMDIMNSKMSYRSMTNDNLDIDPNDPPIVSDTSEEDNEEYQEEEESENNEDLNSGDDEGYDQNNNDDDEDENGSGDGNEENEGNSEDNDGDDEEEDDDDDDDGDDDDDDEDDGKENEKKEEEEQDEPEFEEDQGELLQLMDNIEESDETESITIDLTQPTESQIHNYQQSINSINTATPVTQAGNEAGALPVSSDNNSFIIAEFFSQMVQNEFDIEMRQEQENQPTPSSSMFDGPMSPESIRRELQQFNSFLVGVQQRMMSRVQRGKEYDENAKNREEDKKDDGENKG